MTMQITEACLSILHQLTHVTRQIDAGDFHRPAMTLGNATLGQHIRHTLEFFICLEEGFEPGIVNYDKRNHDAMIEADKFLALAVIERVHDFISSQIEDRPLILEVCYGESSEAISSMATNYVRELTYNIEHAVHHMAIMKIGLREIAPYVEIPSDFGIAASTLRFRQTLVAAR